MVLTIVIVVLVEGIMVSVKGMMVIVIMAIRRAIMVKLMS